MAYEPAVNPPTPELFPLLRQAPPRQLDAQLLKLTRDRVGKGARGSLIMFAVCMGVIGLFGLWT